MTRLLLLLRDLCSGLMLRNTSLILLRKGPNLQDRLPQTILPEGRQVHLRMISNHTRVETGLMHQHAQTRDLPIHHHHQIVRNVQATHLLQDKTVTAETRQGLRAMTVQAIHLHQGQAMIQEVMTGQVIHLRHEVMIHSVVTTDQVIHLLQDPGPHPEATVHLPVAAVAADLQEAVEEVQINRPLPREAEDKKKTYHFTKLNTKAAA